ncbi:MAG: hypothetical protein SFW08_05720 [Gemmatimonadaceae bacterium]|nr:hypothetical protein [Gemmatimonadaceae bacterium]
MRPAVFFAAALAAFAGSTPVLAQSAPVGPELSPGVSWEPHGPYTRAVGMRRLNEAEVKLAKSRSDGFYKAFISSVHFRTPKDRAHLVVSAASIDAPDMRNGARSPVLLLGVGAYWSVPRDVRRLKGGILAPKLGGAHDLQFFYPNRVPTAEELEDRFTFPDFSRHVVGQTPKGYFAQPKEFGTIGGGSVFADVLVFTRDGRSVLEPAPLGALLDIEIARLDTIVRQNADIERDRLAEAEASLAPDQVEARRAKREAVWKRETPNAQVLAKRLADAHRSDLAEVERVRRDVAPLAVPNPRHRTSGPQLALATLRRLAASLDAAGRAQPACARKDPEFISSAAVRFEPLGSTPDCVPMVKVRDDLLDPKRPMSDVQLMTVPFSAARCGEMLGGVRPYVEGGRCGYAVPLLREMDWGLLRQALGWP